MVNCPKCDSYYKLKAERFGARGAKLTCPKCSTLFLVFQPADTPSIDDATPANLDRFDFRQLGLDWQLRDPAGELHPMKNLATLRWLIDHDRVAPAALLAFNGGTGIAVSEIDDLTAYFWDVFERACSGQLGFSAPMLAEDSLPGRVPPSGELVEELAPDEVTEAVEVGSPPVGNPLESPRYGVLPPDSVPPVINPPTPEAAAEPEEKVYLTGSHSTISPSSSALFPALALLFVFALALAVTLPFALQGMRGEPASAQGAVTGEVIESAPATEDAGVVESRVTAEAVPPVVPSAPVASEPPAAEVAGDGADPEQPSPEAVEAAGVSKEASAPGAVDGPAAAGSEAPE